MFEEKNILLVQSSGVLLLISILEMLNALHVIFSFQVRSILKYYRWAPFLPVATDSSMLSVLLLLSKYRLRNVPVIEQGQPLVKNYITQSAVVRGLEGCKGRDWFDCISTHSISDLGLPFMSTDEVRLL